MRWGLRIGAFAVVLALVAASTLARATTTLRGEDPPFTATIPDGFRAIEGMHSGAYAFGETVANGLGRTIVLRVLDGTIANQPITLADARAAVRAFAPDATVRVDHAPSMGVDVPLLVAETSTDDALVVATLPVSPRALQLTVSGPRAEHAAVESLARTILASVRARTNWLTAREVREKKFAWLALALGALLGLAYVALRAFAAKRRAVAVALLAVTTVAFAIASALIAALPHGATRFEPFAPAGLATLALVQLVLVLRTRAARERPQ